MKTQNEVKHTPTPWAFVKGRELPQDDTIRLVSSQTGEALAEILESSILTTDQDFIVRAVNSHEALLEALKKAENDVINHLNWQRETDNGPDIETANTLTQIRHAISQAEGEK